MIEINDINVTFNKASENEVIALDSVHTIFNSREWVFIIGGNGSGKSTLLKLLNQELIPDKGSILMDGITQKDVSFVDQNTLKNLVPSMSVYENLILGLQQNGLLDYLRFYGQKLFKEKIIKVLKSFNKGLENRLNEQVRFLSGGEQQIIIATRILLSKSKVLLMDEFTSSLDQKLAPEILEKLKKHVIENDITVIAVTHDYSQIKAVGDRILMLKAGKLIEDKNKSTFDFSTQSILKLFYDK